jgi:hypothetical protein
MVMEITHTARVDTPTNPDPTITGTCKSGAALGCEGTGFKRILPESMIPGSTPESMIQCTPCYERSAEKYAALMARRALR